MGQVGRRPQILAILSNPPPCPPVYIFYIFYTVNPHPPAPSTFSTRLDTENGPLPRDFVRLEKVSTELKKFNGIGLRRGRELCYNFACCGKNGRMAGIAGMSTGTNAREQRFAS